VIFTISAPDAAENKRENTGNIEKIIEAGKVFISNDMHAEAIAEFTKAIAIDPLVSIAYYLRARAYSLAGDFERAITDFTKAIELNPTYADAYYERGLVYDEHIHDRIKAIDDFTKALRLRAAFSNAYFSRGAAFIKYGKYDEAIVDFNAFIRMDRNSGEAYCNRAVAYYYKGEYQKAWDDIRTSKELGCEARPAFIRKLELASGKNISSR